MFEVGTCMLDFSVELFFFSRVMLKNEENMVQNQVNFDRDRSRPTFALIIHFLAKIHQMLHYNVYFTKR